ncbi:S1 RNA-binding domain-containing protein 1-like isoform X2 [Tubulanus polymorphus]
MDTFGEEKLDVEPDWKCEELIADKCHLELWAVKNVMKLLDADNTVPFIARYRKEMTNNMEAETIREVESSYEELKNVKKKIATVMTSIKKLEKLDRTIASILKNCQTVREVEEVYAPYKPGSKRSLAERARELGLEDVAMNVLRNPQRQVDFCKFLRTGTKGLSTIAEIKSGVQHVIADIIAKDKDIMNGLRKLFDSSFVRIESHESKTVKKGASEETAKRPAAKTKSKTAVPSKETIPEETAAKYQQYFDFSCNLKQIKPHQVLALNRGENKKVLTVKINIPRQIKDELSNLVKRKWHHVDRNSIVRDSVEDAYKRIIEPSLIRHSRAELTKEADKASIDVFTKNLSRLLSMPPVRGKVVMGLDPGFKHGCKLAVTSPSGQVLHTEIAYIHSTNNRYELDKIISIVQKHRVQVIAIGNGTACRESENCISDMINKNAFYPLDVVYCIVSESGASIYSASDVAKEELPDLDISYRGAVSISRRLQDPLAELVKIDPKHLGIGMYQHDVPENKLKLALGNTIEDIVSFVGADLNLSSQYLLRHIAGIGPTLAKRIVEHRENMGLFVNREQLRNVKGLGPKTFKQCAGFVRILPQSSHHGNNHDEVHSATLGRKRRIATDDGPRSKKSKLDELMNRNPLDMTIIHPESYGLTRKLLDEIPVSLDEIGNAQFTSQIQRFIAFNSMESLAKKHNVGEPTVCTILNALKHPIDYDLREEFEKPLFKKSAMSIDDLKVNLTVTGRVSNVTHFGAFVDIGVGMDGLIHNSQMKGQKIQLGDRVDVVILSVDKQRKRIGLKIDRNRPKNR